MFEDRRQQAYAQKEQKEPNKETPLVQYYKIFI